MQMFESLEAGEASSDGVLVEVKPPLERRWSVKLGKERWAWEFETDPVEVGAEDSRCNLTRQVKGSQGKGEFWDVFEESNDLDCDQHLPGLKDYLSASGRLVMALGLILPSLALTAGVHISLLLLSSKTADVNTYVSRQSLLLGLALLPSLVSIPACLWHLHGLRPSAQKFPLKPLSMICIGSCLQLASFSLLTLRLMANLDLIGAFLLMVCVGGLPHLLAQMMRDVSHVTDIRPKDLMAALVQVVVLVYVLYGVTDASVLSGTLACLSLSTAGMLMVDRSFIKTDKRNRLILSIAYSVTKVVCGAVVLGIFLHSTAPQATQKPALAAYTVVCAVCLGLTPFMLEGLARVVGKFQLNMMYSTVLRFSAPLVLLTLTALSYAHTEGLCLSWRADGVCEVAASLRNWRAGGWLLILILILWSWSHLICLDAPNSPIKSPSMIQAHLIDLYATHLVKRNTESHRVLRLSPSNQLPSTKARLLGTYENTTPKIYLCATMWHENETEMRQLLMSILRMDDHQRLTAHTTAYDKSAGAGNTADFVCETHVMFDDAISPGNKRMVNSFVEQFVRTLEDLTGETQSGLLATPVMTPTPYGGQLKFTLPGGSRMVVHLKDKKRIRNKKRWSMIQYMYYLLGYGLMGELRDDAKSFAYNSSKTTSCGKPNPNNAFILTIDGDVSFNPDSVKELLRQIQSSARVGVVCGRIHPMGSGLLVWYQRFEYAIAHWLHKTAEQVLGVVLCAPGAFSLYRASALMDKNVLKTFTTQSTTAVDMLRREQGEDRWLCSLLCQQGYRSEYCSAAAAWTYAPETLEELFNQRRRWNLSTVVHQMDLIFEWRRSRVNRNDISLVYMLFQAFMLLTTFVGSAYIMFILAHASHEVLGLSLDMSYLLAALPPFIYGFACCCLSTTNQVRLALGLAVYYGCLMSAYFVMMIVTLPSAGGLTLLSCMHLAFMSLFVLSAALHPAEFKDLFPCVIYYLMMPTMFMTLMIYSIINLNNVSWGTRVGANTDESIARGTSSGVSTENDSGWCRSDCLAAFDIQKLDDEETKFWQQLISRYLSPASAKEEKVDQMSNDLSRLRNACAVVYFSSNTVAIVACYLLQKNFEKSGQIHSGNSDPVSMFCMLAFGSLVLVQFLCLVWRWASRQLRRLILSLIDLSILPQSMRSNGDVMGEKRVRRSIVGRELKRQESAKPSALRSPLPQSASYETDSANKFHNYGPSLFDV